ncbi:Early nodulin-93 [Vigna angularis]|uniref:Early nodulin-93 n=1 Tax=Phaseolus angularis TaxID=3914 RepID=A0A8T0L8L6_PHAAN|nr:Early nodulin-93 [Vigna angularis]
MAHGNVAANSSFESSSLASLDQKLTMGKRCSNCKGVVAELRQLFVATLAIVIPSLASVSMLLPWTRANLNHTAQALIISTESELCKTSEGVPYLIVADKTVLATARKNSFNPPSIA